MKILVFDFHVKTVIAEETDEIADMLLFCS